MKQSEIISLFILSYVILIIIAVIIYNYSDNFYTIFYLFCTVFSWLYLQFKIINLENIIEEHIV